MSSTKRILVQNLCFVLGMYQIVILPDNRIPDILLIETKPDSRISCNFLEPDSDIRPDSHLDKAKLVMQLFYIAINY